MFRCKRCGAINRAAALGDGKADRVVCGRCKSALDVSGTPQSVNSAGLAQALSTSPVPVLVDFWAPRCQPCLEAGPVVDQVAREHAGSVITLRLNTEQEPVPAIVHGVRMAPTFQGSRGIPTFVLFKSGREVARRSGVPARAQLARWLQSVQ